MEEFREPFIHSYPMKGGGRQSTIHQSSHHNRSSVRITNDLFNRSTRELMNASMVDFPYFIVIFHSSLNLVDFNEFFTVSFHFINISCDILQKKIRMLTVGTRRF